MTCVYRGRLIFSIARVDGESIVYPNISRRGTKFELVIVQLMCNFDSNSLFNDNGVVIMFKM